MHRPVKDTAAKRARPHIVEYNTVLGSEVHVALHGPVHPGHAVSGGIGFAVVNQAILPDSNHVFIAQDLF